ncbi:X-ray radiation resistance-associated protein 1 [Nematolebias whitei]|uniref:X-ray radiation resistance-associated protein 1 n=1 Tax=Nematolebias whitei TaxID=451745 RepID=UPI00189C368D|nr:X-ray radiation resistance-associated protein 1 [Nematolebias whitei]
MAHRKTEWQRHRNMHRRTKETYRNENVQAPRGATLDADFLLQLHFVDEPSQLCSVDINERKLNSVNPEGLKLFTNVAQVDASINALTLGSFGCFVSLRELNLSLNGIHDVSFHAADFPHLEVLDLSYNHLSAQGLVSLGQLPCLRTLHLTGNQLHRLPLTFASSEPDHAELPAEEGVRQFEALEVLLLDNNRLSSNVFFSLTNLKRLQNLNLQGNRISAVPLIKVGDSSNVGQSSAEDGGHTNSDEYLKTMETLQMDSWDKDRKGRPLPLPELQHLNLAENKISTEEALVGAAQFPKLREIQIHSNPLITQKRGSLPLLTFYLQERRGIEIKRHNEQKAKKLPLQVFVDPKWKVEENLRNVSKRRFLTNPVCLTQTQNEKCEETIQEVTQSEDKNTSVHKNMKHFFITQAEDEPEFELLSSSQKRLRNSSGPEESTSYKTIQGIKANPDVLKSIGIHTAVRMLEHRLRNLNVYRDSKPKLDSIQTPYREREKKIKELPPVRPKMRASQRVDEMMKEMKASSAIKVVTLGV